MPNTELTILPSIPANISTIIYPVIEMRKLGHSLDSLSFFFIPQLVINRKFSKGINLQWQTTHKYKGE